VHFFLFFNVTPSQNGTWTCLFGLNGPYLPYNKKEIHYLTF